MNNMWNNIYFNFSCSEVCLYIHVRLLAFGIDYLILIGGGGRGQEGFSREKNPGPNFLEKNIQDRENSTICFVLII